VPTTSAPGFTAMGLRQPKDLMPACRPDFLVQGRALTAQFVQFSARRKHFELASFGKTHDLKSSKLFLPALRALRRRSAQTVHSPSAAL
jgi:hypothetical protein